MIIHNSCPVTGSNVSSVEEFYCQRDRKQIFHELIYLGKLHKFSQCDASCSCFIIYDFKLSKILLAFYFLLLDET